MMASFWNYPQSEKGTVVDRYFETEVADPYRWLEDEHSEKTKKWVEEQSKFTEDYLKGIPFRERIKSRLEELWNYPKYGAPFKVGKFYFFYKNEGLQPQPVLYIQEGLKGEARVFLDPNTLSPDGTVAIGGLYPSRGGRYLAYAVQKAGSDWSEFFVLEVPSGKRLADHIEWVKFSGAAWWKEGFFYTRFDPPSQGEGASAGHEFAKIYYHRLGTPQSEDSLIWQGGRKQLCFAGVTEDERTLALYIQEMGKKGNLLSIKDLANLDNPFVPIQEEFGTEIGVIESEGEDLYLLTNAGAKKNRVVAANLEDPSSKTWRTLILEKEDLLESVSLVDGKLIATYLRDVKNEITVYDLSGKVVQQIELPCAGSVSGFSGRKNDQELFYVFTSFTYPPAIYRYETKTGRSSLFRKSEVKFLLEDYVSRQIFYSSKDGAKIPMFLVYKKGIKLDGTNPTVLYGYGGFNVSLNPVFSISRIAMLERGVVFAIPNLRGGGEYGEAWHEAGTKMNKQNVFDDFIAAAEVLFKEKITSPARLALSGGSNGGLLVGAVVNQRPDLCKVAFPAVGVMDMLRYQKFTIGAAWARDYGTSEESKEMFEYLYRYSPLHSIKKDVNYPAVLITTADHDDRVVPAHSFKYAAALQDRAGASTKNPLMIRIERNAGHGAGKPTQKVIEEVSDVYSFMLYNMGVEVK